MTARSVAAVVRVCHSMTPVTPAQISTYIHYTYIDIYKYSIGFVRPGTRPEHARVCPPHTALQTIAYSHFSPPHYIVSPFYYNCVAHIVVHSFLRPLGWMTLNLLFTAVEYKATWQRVSLKIHLYQN